ncbi:MAG: hypothetical protein WBV77_07855 [Solirubrobacteraceae bacterium]
MSVAHGEETLKGVDHGYWTAWRDVALGRASEFRQMFDPLETLSTFALGAGLTVEELARCLGSDSTLDPLGAISRGVARS